MAGEQQARRRKAKEKIKDAGAADSEQELDEPPTGGSTCGSIIVALLLLALVGVLGTLIHIQSGAVEYGLPPAPQRPLGRSAEVVVEHSAQADSSQPQAAEAGSDGTTPSSGQPAPPPHQQRSPEGSEQPPAEAGQQVRVRQMLRIQTHPDGSVTEEVVSEQLLNPGDEGYDDLGKEPVTVAVHSEPVQVTSAKPVMTTTAEQGD